MSKAKHTPTPWVQEAEYISAMVPGGRPNGEIIVQCWPTVSRLRHETPNEANAAFIVRACNTHEELLDSLRLAIAAHEDSSIWLDAARAALAHCQP